MMRLSLAEVPIEVRAEAAWHRICAGDDPFVALHAALWPESVAEFEGEAAIIDGYCVNGHPWTEENTYVRPNGWRKCRACMRLHKRGRYRRRSRHKQPCVDCGAPATSPRDGGKGRCRRCWLVSVRAGT